jgi:hypothetical protein
MRAVCLLFVVMVAVHSAAEADELTGSEIIAARKIYVAKCAKCHRFYEPTNYAEADWRLWMQKMNKKSKLKEPQAKLLNQYLDVYRAGQLTGKPHEKPTPSSKGTASR